MTITVGFVEPEAVEKILDIVARCPACQDGIVHLVHETAKNSDNIDRPVTYEPTQEDLALMCGWGGYL